MKKGLRLSHPTMMAYVWTVGRNDLMNKGLRSKEEFKEFFGIDSKKGRPD